MTLVIVRQLVRMTFLFIRERASMNFSIRQLAHTNFAIRQHDFFDPSACTIDFVDPSSCTHAFSDPSACTHHSCDLSRVVPSTAFTVCALTKYTPPFSDQRFVSITQLQASFLCKMCLNSLFTPAFHTQDRLRHVHHIEIIPLRLTAISQAYMSHSGFLERVSIGTSETIRTFRLFQLGVPTNHLRHTLTDAPLSIITSPSSRATQPSWLTFTSLISFSTVNTCSFPGSALTFSISTSFTILSWLARDQQSRAK